MKKQNTHLPFTMEEYKLIKGKSKMVDLLMLTGLRASALLTLIDVYKKGDTRVVLNKNKGRGKNNDYIVYLNKSATKLLDVLSVSGIDWDRFKLRRHVIKIAKDCGIIREDITTHTTRATFATQLIENGVDLVTIQTLMNHSKIETTARYIRVSELTMMSGINTLLKENTIMGMTPAQMKKEIIALRKRIEIMESK